MLCRLIYFSRAVPELGYSDLKEIMEKSEKNNFRDGITGMLCYGNSMFLQILEGDRKAVSQTYARIAGDERHFDPELVSFTEVDVRLFTDWSMKVVQLSPDSNDRIKTLIMKYSCSLTFSPETMSAKQCEELMIEISLLRHQL